jgi:nucleoside-diphosphate-sugar epimerase
MKLFVTGGTGFIGSHFIYHALNAGHSVRAIRRAESVNAKYFSEVEWLDLNLDAVESGHFEGCEAFIHFAAAGVSPKQEPRNSMFYYNSSVPQLLIQRAHDSGLRRVVIAGTFAEYGLSANNYEFIPHDAPLLPTTSYASSKAACFVTCHAAAIELGLELCYLRIFSAFGEGQHKLNFWPSLRDAALRGRDFEMTSGEQVRDFVPVDQVAKSFLHATTRKDISGASPLVRNVGSGSPVTMRMFAETWWKRFNATGTLKVGALSYRPNEVMRYAPVVSEYSFSERPE